MKRNDNPLEPPNHDAASALGRRLRSADGQTLLDLVREHRERLTPPQARLVLLNPFATTEVIKELLGVRHLTSEASVRAALARHRRTPENDTLRLLPHLFWRDLLEVAVDLRLRPNVRRIAERYLLARLPRLTPGERTALARRAGPQVLAELLGDPTPRVVRAALDNPHLTQQLLLPLAGRPLARPQILELVGRHPRWGPAREVRFALARNPATPYGVLFDLLPLLSAEELTAIREIEDHSSIIHHRVEELLADRTPKSLPETGEVEVWEI